MKNIRENNILYVVVFLGMIFFLGIIADKNLYRFKYYGELQSNYEFGTTSGDIQTEYTVNFPFKVQLIDFNGLVRKVIGQREMNGTTKLNNGYLTTVEGTVPDELIEANVEAVISYSEYCKRQGIQLLYVQAPYKISKWNSELPTGVTDGHNAALDKLVKKLSDGGVDTMDIRECIHDEGINQYEFFYKTDHHWTTEGGFYAYQKIAPWIAEHTGTYIDESLLNFDNYKVDIYEKWHLGSCGQRTGSLFAGIDDYDLIYPQFDTYIFNRADQSTKNFKDALVKIDVFENQNAQYRYTYDTAYTNSDINDLTSKNAKSNLKVLLLSDSFQHAIKPYMLLTYKELHVAEYWELSTSILEQYKPDVVVILTWGGNVSSPDKNAMQFIDDVQAE